MNKNRAGDIPLRYALALGLKGIPVRRVIAEAKAREKWPAHRIQAYREARLRELLELAKDRFAFYRARLPAEISSNALSHLQGIPFLTKEDLRGELADEAFHRNRSAAMIKTTGGSTGEPVRVIKDRRGLAQELGVQWRGYAWHGLHPRDRQARFWSLPQNLGGRVRAKLVDWASNRSTFPAFDISEGTWIRYAERLERFNPAYIYGYVSMIGDFARFLVRTGRVAEFRPKVVITTAEPLDEESREAISRCFDAPVRNEYGCGEVGVIAMECERGSLHLTSDNLIVEVVDDSGQPVVEGTGTILVTDLFNFSMPIIRYRVGDVVSVLGGACRCGRPFPTIGSVCGRAYDAIRTLDGRVFYGALVTKLFANLAARGFSVKGYQVVQTSETQLDVNVVPRENEIEALRQEIGKYFASQLGGGMRISVKKVEEIPREPSGKIRVVKSTLSESASH